MNNNIIEKPITTLPYNEVKFKFITNHYDYHLDGSCIYENSICKFSCEYPQWNEDIDDYDEALVNIYKLSFFEKLKYIWKQWLFEKCVGYHYSYKNGKRGKGFYYRNPEWLYVWIFNIYYGR
jgi:hypothetical protein